MFLTGFVRFAYKAEEYTQSAHWFISNVIKQDFSVLIWLGWI